MPEAPVRGRNSVLPVPSPSLAALLLSLIIGLLSGTKPFFTVALMHRSYARIAGRVLNLSFEAGEH